MDCDLTLRPAILPSFISLIVITLPDTFPGETTVLNKLFAESGLRLLHLRKPCLSERETEGWIRQIRPEFRRSIVLHDHFNLARQYGLRGIHLNNRNPDVPAWLNRGDFTLSHSCHSTEEVGRVQEDYDYVFLSPVFDSISKPGYKAAFTRERLAEARDILSRNVYALGGITFERLGEVRDMGFFGAAMMGGFWESKQ